MSKLKQIFDYTGFSYLWGSTGVVDDGCIKAAFEMRASDFVKKLLLRLDVSFHFISLFFFWCVKELLSNQGK